MAITDEGALRRQVVSDLAAGRGPPEFSAASLLAGVGLGESGNGRQVAQGDATGANAMVDAWLAAQEQANNVGTLLDDVFAPGEFAPTEAKPEPELHERFSGRDFGFYGPLPPGVTPLGHPNAEATEAMNAVRKPVFEAAEKQADEDRWLEARRIARMDEGLPLGASKEEIEEYQRATRRPRPPIERATEAEEPGAWARFAQGTRNLVAGQLTQAMKVEPLLRQASKNEVAYRITNGLYDRGEDIAKSVDKELELGLPMYSDEAARLQGEAYVWMAELGPQHFPAAKGMWNRMAQFGGDIFPLIVELGVLRRAGLRGDKFGKLVAPKAPMVAEAVSTGAGFGISEALKGREGGDPYDAIVQGMTMTMAGGLGGKLGGALLGRGGATAARLGTGAGRVAGVGGYFAEEAAAAGGDPLDIMIAGVVAPIMFHAAEFTPFAVKGLRKSAAYADRQLAKIVEKAKAGGSIRTDARDFVRRLVEGRISLSKSGRAAWQKLTKDPGDVAREGATEARIAEVEASLTKMRAELETVDPRRLPALQGRIREDQGVVEHLKAELERYHAVKARVQQEGREPEHPRVKEERPPTEAGRADRARVGAEVVPREEVKPAEEAKPAPPEEVREVPVKPPVAEAAKEPWEMMQGEAWKAESKIAEGRHGADRPGGKWQDWHKRQIEQALSEGKPVPPEVLKDYPELRAKEKPVEPTEPRPVEPPKVEAEKEAPGVEERVEPKPEIVTPVPKHWRGMTLYDWGTKGLRTEHGAMLRDRTEGGRKRKTFKDDWVRELERIDVPNANLVRRVKTITEDVWPVKRRKGKYWSTAYYLAPKLAVRQAKAEMLPEVEVEVEVGAEGGTVPFMPSSHAQAQPTTMAGEARPQVSAAKLVDMMGKAAGVPMRVGHGLFKQRKAAGWFDPGKYVVRQKVANQLTTAAHEFGHAVNDKIAGWGVKWPTAVAKELQALGRELYGDRKPSAGYRREGFAEYTARLFLGDEAIPKVAKATHEWFEGALKGHPEFAGRWTKIKEGFAVYREQGAPARVASQIEQVQRGPLTKGLDALGKVAAIFTRPLWITDAAPLEAAERKLIKERGLENLRPDQVPSTLRAALRMNAPGMARYAVTKAIFSPRSFRPIGKSLVDHLRPIRKELQDFVVYAVARRGVLLHERGINPGISKADAGYTVKQLESPEFRRALDGVTEWSNWLLDYLVDAGGLTGESAKAIRAMNPIYVPFKRFFDSTYVRGRMKGGRRGAVDQPMGVKRIKGSGRQIRDIIDSFVQQAEEMISLGNKLRVAQSVVNLATEGGKGAWFAEKIPTPKTATTFKVGDVLKQLVEMGVVPAGKVVMGPDGPTIETESGKILDMDNLLTVFQNTWQYLGKDNIAVLWRNGKREFWEFDPDVYRVLTEMDKEYLPSLARAFGFGMAKRGVQLGATGLSATFGLVRNPFRDVQQWNIYTAGRRRLRERFLGPAAALEGFWSELRKDPTAQRWEAGGGRMSTLMGQDRAEIRSRVDEALATGAGEKTKMIVRHPVHALRELLSAFEAGPRIVEFKKALAQAEEKYGKDSYAAYIEAMLASKDVTVNFTRMGTAGAVLNSMIPFFNARIQGADKFYRTFGGREGKQAALRATAAAFTWITIPNVVTWWLNRDKLWWREMDFWERYGFIHVDTTGAQDGSGVVSIPGAFELQYVFGGLPVAALEEMYGDYPGEIEGAAWEAIQSFSPVNNILDLLPAAIKPGFEVLANYKTFPEYRNIDPHWDVKGKLPPDRYNQWTTETAKLIGKALNVSPRRVEHFMSGHTGGLALDVVRFGEVLAGMREVGGPADWPIVSGVKHRGVLGRGRSVQEVYDRREQLQKQAGSKKVSVGEKNELKRLNKAIRQIQEIRKCQTAGEIDDKKANQQITDIARTVLGKEGGGASPRLPLLERIRQRKKERGGRTDATLPAGIFEGLLPKDTFENLPVVRTA